MEIIEGIKTGRHLHFFLNPIVNVTMKASHIHNLTNERLEDFPTFEKVAGKIKDFIGDSKIIAHNAHFDRRMLNNELERIGIFPFKKDQFIDTLEIARFLYPGLDGYSQDSLCKKFKIDNRNRSSTGIHSAMEDVILLYHIFQKMKRDLDKNNMLPDIFCSM